jgi:small subunit ribosomal protein S1
MTEDNSNPTAEEISVSGQEMDAVVKTKSISQQYPNVAEFMEQNFKKFDVSDDNYQSMSEKTVTSVKEGELIKGTIINITKDEIRVDINFKSYGIIPKFELINSEAYEIGEEIDVYIDRIEDIQGRIILSRRRADFMRI